MNNNVGKIVAVIGGPRSGKTFLAGKISNQIGAELQIEWEESAWPERIKEDIEKNVRPMERILWFRNKLVEQFMQALAKRNEGQLVVLDTFWLSIWPYVEIVSDEFEREVLRKTVELDRKMLPWPDVTILLEQSEQGIRDFVVRGGRNFDADEDFIVNQAIPLNKLHVDLFKRIGNEHSIILVNRDNIDFEDSTEVNKIVQKIKKELGE